MRFKGVIEIRANDPFTLLLYIIDQRLPSFRHLFVFCSDDITHDASFVYKIIEAAVEFITTRLIPDIKAIPYFSDGYAGECKNRKHFYNLCFHASDFSVDCRWNIFTRSYGKLLCDGIKETVKE